MLATPIDIIDPTLRFTVTSNGTVIQDLYPVVAITVHHEVNRISYAEILLSDGSVSEDNSASVSQDGVIPDFPASDSTYFIPGAVIKITAGYGSSAESLLFTGIVVKQAIQVMTDGSFRLQVTCKHKAVKLTLGRKDAVFSDQLDSNIINTLISAAGLSATVKATSGSNEIVFQKFASDWDFLLARAEFNGYIITQAPEDIFVGPPAVSSSAVLRVAFGESIISFHAELNAERQPPSIAAAAWDPRQQTLLTSQAAEPSVNKQGNIGMASLAGSLGQSAQQLISNTPMLQNELQTWANSTLLRARLQASRGNVSFMGNATVLPNTLIELQGVGTRFSGDAYVSAVTHTLEDGKWTTDVRFGLENKAIYEKEHFSGYPANGQLPAINGLQLATVVAISEDPGAEYRVQVKLASTAEGQVGTWARLANFYATAKAGAFFYPELGDEVVIGFLENDPRYPIVLGSLYSQQKTPPFTPADNMNYTKALVTKAQLKVTFDDEKKVITLITPGNNTIVLSDTDMGIKITDQNGNNITTAASGITITSAANLDIKASGKITINGDMGITVSSPMDVAVSGLNINNTAQMAFTGSGNLSAQVSASGTTIIQGAIVMIN